MTAPESFAELAELFDRGWRIATLAVDVRDDRQYVRITLERKTTQSATREIAATSGKTVTIPSQHVR